MVQSNNDKSPHKAFLNGLALLADQSFKSGLGIYDIVGLMEVFKTSLITKQVADAISDLQRELESYKDN